MKYAVFSDIHANITALQACYDHFLKLKEDTAKIVILGDYIDYGPRPNETISFIISMNPDIIICGNHEQAIYGTEDSRFASPRGVESAALTRKLLNAESNMFISKYSSPYKMAEYKNIKILFIHGDLSDPLWGKMPAEEVKNQKYAEYDFVISGHTHIPHLLEIFYDDANPSMRNKKKTIFLNPGSVGQPRNHCQYAQYLFVNIETEAFMFYKVPYNIPVEQSYYPDSIYPFYKERLSKGI